MSYVVVDIGCLECGEESYLLGIFDDLAAAKSKMEQAEKMQLADWKGQHNFVIWDAETKEEVD